MNKRQIFGLSFLSLDYSKSNCKFAEKVVYWTEETSESLDELKAKARDYWKKYKGIRTVQFFETTREDFKRNNIIEQYHG